MSLINKITMNLQNTYNKIDPGEFPLQEYPLGSVLNDNCSDDDDTAVSNEGHMIVCLNQIISDGMGQQYRVVDVLGNGTFSYVFKCQILNREDIEFAAIKIIKNLPQYKATAKREIQIHEIIANAPDCIGKKKILSPISTFEIDDHVCIVTPILSRSLFEGICQTQSPLSLLNEIRDIMVQLLQALEFIHKINIIHCDIKPDNIIYLNESRNEINLIDFGSACLASQIVQGKFIQSRFYRSFEVLMGLPYDNKIDIWSAGCVAAELYLDFAIFACDCEFDLIHTMTALLGDAPEFLISSSQNWWKFYDITPQGFKLKMNTKDVLLKRHLYNSVFEKVGAVSLEELIMLHFTISSEEEYNSLVCFLDFIQGMLKFDPNKRFSASEALNHPFITGEKLTTSAGSKSSNQNCSEVQYTKLQTNSTFEPLAIEPISNYDFLSLI